MIDANEYYLERHMQDEEEDELLAEEADACAIERFWRNMTSLYTAEEIVDRAGIFDFAPLLVKIATSDSISEIREKVESMFPGVIEKYRNEYMRKR